MSHLLWWWSVSWLSCLTWWSKCCFFWLHVLYNRKLSREKILRFCSYSRKLSPQNWGAWHLLAATPVSNLWKFSLQNCYFRQIAKVFSLESFPLYGSFMNCFLVMCNFKQELLSISSAATLPSIPQGFAMANDVQFAKVSCSFHFNTHPSTHWLCMLQSVHWNSSPHLLVTPAQLMRPSISRNAILHSVWLCITSRPPF